MERFIYDSVIIRDETNPFYNSSLGIVIDKNSGQVIYNLPEKEIAAFFYFKIEFDSFKYDMYFQPKTNGYKTKMDSRKYDLVLYLNMPAIVRDNGINDLLYKKLSVYLTRLQINEFRTKKTYMTKYDEIDKFISNRENNLMYFIPWTHFRINNKYAFDMKHYKIIPANQVNKNNFIRKGGIIETNNVRKLINENFSDGKNLIILSPQMSDLWPDSHKKILYDDLSSLNKTDIKTFKKKFDRIIVHECSINTLSMVKKFVNLVGIGTIWLINSLPLTHYLSEDKNNKNLVVNQIHTISNLWMNLELGKKKIFKRELVRLYLTIFNKYYTKINYPENMCYTVINNQPTKPLDEKSLSLITTKYLELSELEREIYNQFNKYYSNWKNNLSNDFENMYSIATKKKLLKVEKNILNSMMILYLAVIKRDYVPIFFEKRIKKIIKATGIFGIQMERMISFYENVNNIPTTNNIINVRTVHHEPDLQPVIDALTEKKTQMENTITNYKRYLKLGKGDTNFMCPVCYSSENLVQTKLICGHHICLECILNTLSRINECPICKEFININKIAIIEESVPKIDSHIISYLKNLDDRTLILTDLDAISNISHLKYIKNKNNDLDCYNYRAKVINITEDNLLNKLAKIKKSIKKIVIFGSQNFLNKYSNFVCYFNNLNKPPIVEKVEINNIF